LNETQEKKGMRGRDGASIKSSENIIAGHQSRIHYPFRHSNMLSAIFKRTALVPAAGACWSPVSMLTTTQLPTTTSIFITYRLAASIYHLLHFDYQLRSKNGRRFYVTSAGCFRTIQFSTDAVTTVASIRRVNATAFRHKHHSTI